jgi:cytochrome c-type biogenesis protein CcmH/NrfG
VADYGEACLLLANRERSLRDALRGRDALKQAIGLDPGQLSARSSLMEFYARAPWPWGSSAGALAQAGEIARRDRARGLRAFLRLGQIFSQGGARSAARAAFQSALKLDPGNGPAAAALAGLGPQAGPPAGP